MGVMTNLTKKSTSKFIVNDKNLLKQERELLEYSGIENIKGKSIQVGEFEGKPVCIRTQMINIQELHSKPVLVFVHGYAASGSLYYQIFKGLSERFCLVVTDIIGMGASSRPRDYNKDEFTPQQSIDYFVEYFEKWRIAFGKLINKDLTDFILVGHSFGGYISANYAIKYHKNLRKLILISPIGVRVKDPDEQEFGRVIKKMREAKDQGIKPPPLWAKIMLKFAWSRKITPFQVARLFGQKWTRKQIDAYLDRRCSDQKMDETEKEICSDYIFHLFMRDGTSEFALLVMFTQGIQAHLPLGAPDKLASPDFPIAISYILGDVDWVRFCDQHDTEDRHYGQIIIEQNKKAHGENSNFYECPTAGHNMHMDNPEALTNIIINDVFYANDQNERLPILKQNEYKRLNGLKKIFDN